MCIFSKYPKIRFLLNKDIKSKSITWKISKKLQLSPCFSFLLHIEEEFFVKYDVIPFEKKKEEQLKFESTASRTFKSIFGLLNKILRIVASGFIAAI